jgi:molybdopterin/thiamine biosynthesis adenylyltransferase
MNRKILHERLFRGEAEIAKLAKPLVTICGAGALGSHLADNLARQGFCRLRSIDDDRVEEHNVSTQLYGANELGAPKVEVLRNRLFRASEVELDVRAKRLDARSAASLLKDSDFVVDTFDNSASRQAVQNHCRAEQIDCLHIGLAADYAEVVWDEAYQVPPDVAGDVCEYPMARNLVLLAVAIAAESLVRFITIGERKNRSITMGDFAVRELES